MEKDYDKDELFLARWISGDLTEYEKRAFEKTDAYKIYNAINIESQRLKGPEIDVEDALNSVKLKARQKNSEVKSIKLWQTIAAAAVIVISLTILFNTKKTYTTGIGERQTIVLQDGSEIELNANSMISHKRFFWNNNKVVYLEGEAYFKVIKGKDFSIKTSKGLVSVLGTEFNIRDRSNFDIKCYEGKIAFLNNTSSKQLFLTQGMQIEIKNSVLNKSNFNEIKPSWIEGFSKFEDEPLYNVLEELSHYYKIKIEYNNIDRNKLFTGRFEYNNLNNALKSTLKPMNINYMIKNDSVILYN